MIARIIAPDGRQFYSYIFAYYCDGFDSTVIAFDSENEKFVRLRQYDCDPYVVRKVFIIDGDCEGWIEKEINLIGYEWVFEDGGPYEAFESGNPVDEEYLISAAGMNATIEKAEWTNVETEQDADNLLAAALSFHDGVVKSVKIEGDKMTVHITGCWNSEFDLVFEGDVKDGYSEEYDEEEYDRYFYQASVLLLNGYVYLVDGEFDDPSEFAEDYPFFRGKTLKWSQKIGVQ